MFKRRRDRHWRGQIGFAIAMGEGSPFNGKVRPLRMEDLQTLKPILEQWIRGSRTQKLLPSEVSRTLEEMAQSLRHENGRTYMVAENGDGNVLGVMGIRQPSLHLARHAQTNRPAEIVNAFVSHDYRGKGVGRALLFAVEGQAKLRGSKELLVSSGPRYKHTAWGFYTKLLGEPAAIIEDVYGIGGDVRIWRKVF